MHKENHFVVDVIVLHHSYRQIQKAGYLIKEEEAERQSRASRFVIGEMLLILLHNTTEAQSFAPSPCTT